jgi:hypothetical protein
LVDFTSLETSVGEWAGVAVDQLLTYLSAEIEDPKGPDGKDLCINDMLRSTLLDENGFLDIEFNDLSIGGDDLAVALKHVRVVGFDSISSFNVLDANELKWERLGVQMVILLMSSEDEAVTGRSLKTTINQQSTCGVFGSFGPARTNAPCVVAGGRNRK